MTSNFTPKNPQVCRSERTNCARRGILRKFATGYAAFQHVYYSIMSARCFALHRDSFLLHRITLAGTCNACFKGVLEGIGTSRMTDRIATVIVIFTIRPKPDIKLY